MEEQIVKDTFQRFFLPTVTASVTLSVISMTDLVIAGRFVGEVALTSISLALPIIILVQILAALFGTGGAIALSARLGRGEMEECSRIFTCALGSALLFGILAGFFGILFLEPIVLLCGGEYGEVMEGARAYMGTLFLGMPFLVLSPVMMTYLRNDNEQKYSMICVITSGLFNIIASAGFAALLHMGIFGIAFATVLSQILSCILASRRLFRKNRSFHLTKILPDKKLFLTILGPGLPVAAIFLSQVILTVVINRILMSAGGGLGVAVYAVTKYLINFLYALFDGVTGSIQPMLGIYYGEREWENIRYTIKHSLAAMFLLALLMFLSMEFFGLPLCRLFGVESGPLTDMTIQAMKLEGFCCLTAAIITYMNAFYRCIGQEKVSFALSIGDNLLFPIGCILFFSRVLSFGITGVWVGLLAGNICTLLSLACYCLYKGKGFLLLDKATFERPGKEYHQIFPATPHQIKLLLPDVERFCAEMDISMKKEYYITLAIEELVVNVISLAQEDNSRHRASKEYYVDIRISPGENGEVGLRIRDNLTEFNPGELSTEDIKSLALENEDSAINLLGIGMVKKIAKDYSYKRTIGFNNFSVLLP